MTAFGLLVSKSDGSLILSHKIISLSAEEAQDKFTGGSAYNFRHDASQRGSYDVCSLLPFYNDRKNAFAHIHVMGNDPQILLVLDICKT